MDASFRDRVAGALYGLLVGEALGGPLAGLSAQKARDIAGERVEMREPVGSRWRPKGLHGAGGQSALAVVEAALRGGDFGSGVQRALLELVEAGATDAGRFGLLRNVPRPLGEVLARWLGRAPAQGAVDDDPLAVLRASVVPLALSAVWAKRWAERSEAAAADGELRRAAEAVVTPTAASASARAGGAAMALAVRDALVGRPAGDPQREASSDDEGPAVSLALRLANEAASFERAVSDAVLRGGDAELVGALVGVLAGARFGRAAIPVRWIDVLMARGTLEDRIDGLLQTSPGAFLPGFTLVELERGWTALVDEGAAYPRGSDAAGPLPAAAPDDDALFEGTSGEFRGSVNETLRIDLDAVRRELAEGAATLSAAFAGSYQDTVKIDRRELAAVLAPPSSDAFVPTVASILRVVKGDITVQEVDVIVNAANTSLLGGGGVDGAIHRRGGPSILEECQAIRRAQGGCKVGDAVVTGAGNLPARWVVHAVGPWWRDGERGEDELLASAYRASLERAKEHGARTVAFSSISTGAYRFPLQRAAVIAVRTLAEAIVAHGGAFHEVRIVAYDDDTFAAFAAARDDELRRSRAP